MVNSEILIVCSFCKTIFLEKDMKIIYDFKINRDELCCPKCRYPILLLVGGDHPVGLNPNSRY